MKYFNRLKLTTLVLLFSVLMAFNSAHAAQYIMSNIATYRIAQFSSSGTAAIDLYDSKRRKIGILVFYPDSNLYDLPAASRDSNGLVRMYYAIESLPTVIDQLRNESPNKIAYWTGSGQNSHLLTSERELVGEGE